MKKKLKLINDNPSDYFYAVEALLKNGAKIKSVTLKDNKFTIKLENVRISGKPMIHGKINGITLDD